MVLMVLVIMFMQALVLMVLVIMFMQALVLIGADVENGWPPFIC